MLNTLGKVKGLIPAEHIRDVELNYNQITIDLTPWAGNKQIQPNLEEIKSALNERKLLCFKYTNRLGEKSDRRVEPYQLVLKETNWYLQAYCTARQDYRIFKLSRISEIQTLSETFNTREFTAKPLKAQYRNPFGPGPSGKTCPKWESAALLRTSVRDIPWLRSTFSLIDEDNKRCS